MHPTCRFVGEHIGPYAGQNSGMRCPYTSGQESESSGDWLMNCALSSILSSIYNLKLGSLYSYISCSIICINLLCIYFHFEPKAIPQELVQNLPIMFTCKFFQLNHSFFLLLICLIRI